MSKTIKIPSSRKQDQTMISIVSDKKTVEQFDQKCKAAGSDRTKIINHLMSLVANGDIVLEAEK